MPTPLGAHNARVDLARELLSKKGRAQHRLFSFEGPTLLTEALQSGTSISTLFVTREALDALPAARELEPRGTDVYVVDDRTMRKISDVETPSGIVAVAAARLSSMLELLADPGIVLVLADLNDPGNAGTLMRSAEAFGIDRVLFGARGTEPYHPKVVRAAMGAIFRQRIAVATALDVQPRLGDWCAVGLAAAGEPLDGLAWPARCLLVVGNERHGLGAWEALCAQFAAIRMSGRAESLNAAVAGSIALYEASRRLHP